MILAKIWTFTVHVCEGLARIHMSLTLDSRFPICILLQSLATFSDLAFIFWPHAPLLVKSISYQIQPFPSRSFKGSHKKISLIFKDAAISCSFSSCFVACFFATQLSNSALSPDHQHFLGVQHYWNTTQTICIFWLSNIEQTYWDKF